MCTPRSGVSPCRGAGGALLAVAFLLAVGTRVTLSAIGFHLFVRAPLLSHHSRSVVACCAPRRVRIHAKKGVVALSFGPRSWERKFQFPARFPSALQRHARLLARMVPKRTCTDPHTPFRSHNMTDQSPRTPKQNGSGKRTRRSISTAGRTPFEAKTTPKHPAGAAAVPVAIDNFAHMAERHLLALNDVADAQKELDAAVKVRRGGLRSLQSSPRAPFLPPQSVLPNSPTNPNPLFFFFQDELDASSEFSSSYFNAKSASASASATAGSPVTRSVASVLRGAKASSQKEKTAAEDVAEKTRLKEEAEATLRRAKAAVRLADQAFDPTAAVRDAASLVAQEISATIKNKEQAPNVSRLTERHTIETPESSLKDSQPKKKMALPLGSPVVTRAKYRSWTPERKAGEAEAEADALAEMLKKSAAIK